MYDARKAEKEIQDFWKEINLLEKIKEKNKDGEKYFLLDGPPYANYVPHAGHMKTTVIKDLYIRLAMMKGLDVWFQPGFDTHGLPIENMVEKEMDLKSKNDIKEMGIKKFINACRKSATENKDLWLEYYEKLGAWYSWKEPYLTYDNSYLESAWWAFKQQWKKNMVYEGKKPVHWCPRCQTALAGYEVTDSYKMVTDPGVYVKFKLKDRDAYLLVFTTTPWTLPSNTIIAVAPDKEYVEVKTEKGNLILAEKRLELLDDFELEYEIKDKFKGEKLVGKEYESLLDLPVQEKLQKDDNALKVYASIPILKERAASKTSDASDEDIYEEFVSAEEGTGMVHCAPGHGKTDNEVGQHYGLPSPSPLDDECKFTEEVDKWQGQFVKDADHDIADYMDQTGKLVHYESIQHNYPLCWRCKSPLIFRLSNQWFLKVDDIKDKMLEQNEEVDWQPEFARERFRNWVANAEDWNFSRQRYWGIPIPVWKNDETGEVKAIGSVEELKEEAIGEVPDDFDLHAASEIKLKGDKGGELERVPHIFDVWYDSGCAPFASLGYPKNNNETFEKYYPVSRISESQDQIRGWFYSLMFVGTSVFDQSPYETVSMPGWVLDGKGDKMSKSVGNMVYATEAIEEHGSDPVRFFYCWDTAPYNTTKFNLDTIGTEVARFFNIYWNLHKYLLSQKKTAGKAEAEQVEDEWILSRLNTVIRDVRENLEAFELHVAGRALYDFIVNDLSRTYVQLVRDRMEEEDAPFNIINHCLLEASKLLVPMAPHAAEKVYQGLKEANDDLQESVHLERMPEAGNSDEELESSMEVAQEVIANALACRDKAQIGARWPLKEIIVDSEKEEVKKALEKLSSIVKNQVNVKKVTAKKMQPDLEVSPDFGKLGPEFGQETGDVANLIKDNAKKLAEALKNGKEEFKLGDYEITADYLKIEKKAPEGYKVSDSKLGDVYLDVKMTKELEKQGVNREITRRTQQARKEIGLEKSDTIEANIVAPPQYHDSLEAYKDSFSQTVGSTSTTITSKPDKKREFEKSQDIKGKKFSINFDVVKKDK